MFHVYFHPLRNTTTPSDLQIIAILIITIHKQGGSHHSSPRDVYKWLLPQSAIIDIKPQQCPDSHSRRPESDIKKKVQRYGAQAFTFTENLFSIILRTRG